MQKKKKHKLKKAFIFKSFSLIVIILSICLFIMFIKLAILPLKYLLLLFIILFVINVFIYLCLASHKYGLRMFGTILVIIFSVFSLIGINYQSVTLDFLQNITFLNIQTISYQIYVRTDANYSSLSDLDKQILGYVQSDEIKKALDEINVNVRLSEAEDTSFLIENLLNAEYEAIMIENSEAQIYLEMNSEFLENTTVIATIEIEVQKEDNAKEVEVTKEPFSIYITGVDTYDGVNTTARSDVNIVITVNPNTYQILMVSIPRDYYVQIYGTTGLKDKLTHAGLRGVNTSIKTIEELLEMDINYYAKFNFTALVDIVDAFGGITIDNPFEFTASYEEDETVYYEFLEGTITLNGKQALAYVRERYSLREGDIARARHQQLVISALIETAKSPTILTKYASILNSLEGNFTTNMSLDNISSLIQMQLKDNPNWTIESIVLSGTDSSELTNSFPNLYSSVLIPDDESVAEAIEKINELTATS